LYKFYFSIFKENLKTSNRESDFSGFWMVFGVFGSRLGPKSPICRAWPCRAGLPGSRRGRKWSKSWILAKIEQGERVRAQMGPIFAQWLGWAGSETSRKGSKLVKMVKNHGFLKFQKSGKK